MTLRLFAKVQFFDYMHESLYLGIRALISVANSGYIYFNHEINKANSCQQMGLWFRGIIPASHAGGPGFNSRRVHFFQFFELGFVFPTWASWSTWVFGLGFWILTFGSIGLEEIQLEHRQKHQVRLPRPPL